MATDEIPETKRCTGCGADKLLVAFYANARGRHGRSSKCAECVRAYMADYHQRRQARVVVAREKLLTAGNADWTLSAEDALHQLAAACRRWSQCEDFEERDGAKDAALYRARQLIEAVGG